MSTFHLHRKRNERPDVGAEAEAFVHGSLHDLVAGEPEQQCWLQLNHVAHGGLTELQALAADDTDSGDPADSESLARHVAREVVSLVEDEDGLRALQREALWPLEAELMASTSSLARSPELVAFLASCALGTCPEDTAGDLLRASPATVRCRRR